MNERCPTKQRGAFHAPVAGASSSASTGQTRQQRLQLTQSAGRGIQGSKPASARQSVGQTCTQSPQPVHRVSLRAVPFVPCMFKDVLSAPFRRGLDRGPFGPADRVPTHLSGIMIRTLFRTSPILFTPRLCSWQTEAVVVVARRSVTFLRLNLLCQIGPSDLWLRTCCILRLDRSSQGSPTSKIPRRTLAAP